MKLVTFAAAIAAMALSFPILADSTVVPAANTGTDGESSHDFILVGSPNQVTYQMVIGSAALTGIPVGSQIVGLTWRLNADGSGAYPSSSLTFSNFDVQMATSRAAPGSLFSTFANNANVDNVTVRTGSLSIVTASYPGGAANPTPNGWGLRIPFTTPFTYEGGDLLITLRVSGNSSASGASLDAVGTGGNLQAQDAASAGASVATSVGTDCLVTRFDFVPPTAVSKAYAPIANANTEGNADYDMLSETASATTTQMIIGAGELAYVSRGSRLTGITWRLDQPIGTASRPTADLAFSQYDIQISRANASVGGMSTVVSDNAGPDAVTVRSGALTIPAGSFPGGAPSGSTNKFGFTIPFTTPYTYTGGDLHVVVRRSSHAGVFQTFDALLPGNGKMQTGHALGSGAVTTSVGDNCPVTRFSVLISPVSSSACSGVPGNTGQAVLTDETYTLGATYQVVIASNELADLHPGSTIDGMTWRLEPNGQGDWPPAGAGAWFGQFNVQVASSTVPPGSMSNTFTSNIGPDEFTVRSGPLVIPPGTFPGGAGPGGLNRFGLYIPFTVPFVYNGGDLCVTVRRGVMQNSTAVSADAILVNTQGYNVRFQGKLAPGANAIGALSDADVVIMRFSSTPSVCVPLSSAVTTGNATSSAALSSADRTVQYLVDESQLFDVPEGSVMTGLSLRRNNSSADGPSRDITFPAYAVQLSTSPNTPSTMSNTFAGNIGPDVVTVRDGALTVPALKLHSQSPGSTAAPNVFYIPFDRAYVYNGGPLCVTIRYTGNAVESGLVDSLTSDPNEAARGATGSAATVANLGANPAILRFSYSPPRCPADYDGNGFVNGEDFDFFMSDFFEGLPFADFNGDGFTNGDDADAFGQHFDAGC